MAFTLTVKDIIKQIFPEGTSFETKGESWSEAPAYPPDLFAITGVLLQRAGAYQHVISAESGKKEEFPEKSILVSAKKRDAILKAGMTWSTPRTQSRIQKLWSSLENCNEPVYQTTNGKKQKWWDIAFELLAIADEASKGAGYFIPKEDHQNQSWVAKSANALLETGAPLNPRSRHIRHNNDAICSITSHLVNTDIVCVQPKSRTPEVGCSLRNISHYLSLLPPRGHMKVHWLTPPAVQAKEHSANLNLLLIPYPYKIENSWIKAKLICDEADNGWGWFEIDQMWLSYHEKEFLNFIDALIEKARSLKGSINGIVLPELSLSYVSYEKLAEHLRDHYPNFDFLVAGTSQNCNEETGNFALASHFYELETGKRAMATVSRPKHHRWSLDASQIQTYDLASSFPVSLASNAKWWEKIPLHQRRIHVNSLRNSSVFTAMICEDLARSDPAHEPLRSVGANLVFVLLMDGPQLEWRWASRYSTGLAEDPGSSVLTLTSRALLERWNADKPDEEKSWSVGIWKDPKNRATPLECQQGAQALLIELAGTSEVERTVDGRRGREAFCWTMVSGSPVQIRLDSKHEKLVKLFCE